jgi:aminoglycoside 6'-N-acetyltransferase I
MTVEIRRVGPGDEGLFERVADDVFDHAVERGVLASYLRPVELYIDEVAVAPAYQRQGVARRMLDEMFELGRELGCAEAWVGTEAGNLPATALYEARGASPEPFVMYVFAL